MTRIETLKERLVRMPAVDVPTGSVLPAIEEAEQEIEHLKKLLKTGHGLFCGKLSEEERWIKEVEQKVNF